MAVGKNGSAVPSSHSQRANQYQGAPTAVTPQIVWDQIVDTPTTIAGYGITDAYTKTEVDAAIAVALAAANAYTDAGLALKVDKATLTTRGDLFVRNATVVTRLGIGTTGKFLKSDGTDPSWQSMASTDLSDFNEAAQDAVGGILTDTSTIDFTYNDGSNTISAAVIQAALSLTASQISDFTEAAQDVIGALLVDSSTIDYTYSDGGNTLTTSVIASALSIAYTQLTYSGLTSGQALVASGASAASFRALTAADVGAGTFGTGDFVFPGLVGMVGTLITDSANIAVADLGATVPGIATNFRVQSNRYNNPGQFAVTRVNGNVGARTAILDAEQMGTMVAGGYDGTAMGVHSAFVYRAAENWSNTAHGYKIQFITVNVGTTTAANRMEIDELGNIIAPGISTSSAIATNATNGFLYTSACAGTPTGTPTVMTSVKPLIIDSTNIAEYFNIGGTWYPLFNDKAGTITYSGTMATDAALGSMFSIVVTNGTAMTMSAPTHAVTGRQLTYSFLNSSGGAMGAITWNGAFKLAGAFTNPANTKYRLITFRYDGTSWFEVNRTAADI